ncbi:CIA30 family protein [Sandarakinorhabdus limnophila]|uniref:CIA30 family protein n=1 Tax=Sandarakinorhabdus limnophila TaxID=210512 RepID=UPI0026EB092B|nr:CIA30 family protein [Sandarakinorhabdus limnophila]
MSFTEVFADDPASRWRFFTDTVMGGVSSGPIAFQSEPNQRFARMTGLVSTANNGGFIQMQMQTKKPLSADGQGGQVDCPRKRQALFHSSAQCSSAAADGVLPRQF